MQIVNLLDRGPLDYMDVDRLQRFIHSQVADQQMPDTFILWESAAVYTAGRRTEDQDIPDTSIPVIRMDRGGSVTYHGPGQLVIYPIIKVRPPKDVVAFVRSTEVAVIDAMRSLGLETRQIDGRSGVWVQDGIQDRKLCAIGIKFADDATLHGLALNVATDIDAFMKVIPCGLPDVGVVALNQLGLTASLSGVADALVPRLAAAYERFARREGEGLRVTNTDELLDRLSQQEPAKSLPSMTGVLWRPKGS